MAGMFLKCFRTARFVKLTCVLSLCLNIVFFISSRHSAVPIRPRQYIESFINEGESIWSYENSSHVTRGEGQRLTESHDQLLDILDASEGHVQTEVERSENNSADCIICPNEPPGLYGPLADMSKDIIPEALISLFPDMKKGRLRPRDCVARERLAIIIPYRNRYPHLHVLLHNLIPFLTRQQADVTFFVVEQAPPETFNRGALLNVGFLEAEKLDRYDCFIFHDTDLIPLDDRHMYRCGDNPRHFAVAMNKYKFKEKRCFQPDEKFIPIVKWKESDQSHEVSFQPVRMPYKDYFGGIVGFSRQQYRNINGCSNVFFGWGGEDDELKMRALNKGYVITRSSVHIARYDMIKHTRDKGNEANAVRRKILSSFKKRQDIEGLNTIRYKLNSISYNHLYIWINVSLNQTEILQSAPSYILEAVMAAQRKAMNESQTNKGQNSTVPILMKKNTTLQEETHPVSLSVTKT